MLDSFPGTASHAANEEAKEQRELSVNKEEVEGVMGSLEWLRASFPALLAPASYCNRGHFHELLAFEQS